MISRTLLTYRHFCFYWLLFFISELLLLFDFWHYKNNRLLWISSTKYCKDVCSETFFYIFSWSEMESLSLIWWYRVFVLRIIVLLYLLWDGNRKTYLYVFLSHILLCSILWKDHQETNFVVLSFTFFHELATLCKLL